MTVTGTPSAELLFDTLNSYQKTAALDAALELDLFTAIDEGARTPDDIARRRAADARGVRILCDYLTVAGFLTKSAGAYQLTPDASFFLSRRSPAFLGSVREFMLSPSVTGNFERLAETIRRGSVAPERNHVAEANPMWVDFARAMAPLMVPAAQAIAALIRLPADRPSKVLDIAAGHGMYGITLGQRHPTATIVAVDWAPVLEVASDNAARAGLGNRYETRPGDAFRVEFGTGYDVALVTNFLHHFDAAACTAFLGKVAASLKPGGQIVIVEFVPNADRVSPPIPAAFALTMLAGTPAGDVYTFEQLKTMLRQAGFRDPRAQALPTPQTVVLATK